MISIHGTYLNGAVVLDQPVNLPEGAHVRVTLDDETVDVCCDGRPWPTTPEGIAAFIAEMDATPGLEISDEDYARMEADRLARKTQGIAENEERMKRISAMFR